MVQGLMLLFLVFFNYFRPPAAPSTGPDNGGDWVRFGINDTQVSSPSLCEPVARQIHCMAEAVQFSCQTDALDFAHHPASIYLGSIWNDAQGFTCQSQRNIGLGASP